MASETAIKIDKVSKSFRLPHERLNTVKSLFVNLLRPRRSYERQQVLKDVSFEIKNGEFFGIIGRNGSGKSTLLKLLAGIYEPDRGQIGLHGKLTPFIELGVGFNPELTGRDNIYLNGALLGFNTKQMEAMYEDIVSFAELEKFMDQKLKNYSSGMQVRLAFSIAIRAKSDILLIDEVLAVGDANFQTKCVEVFEELKREGRTIVFVSHSMSYVRDFCDRVAVIDNSKLLFVGDTENAIDIYNKLNSSELNLRTEAENRQAENATERIGNGKAEIVAHHIYNQAMEETVELTTGQPFTVSIEVAAKQSIDGGAVGVMFRRHPNENLYGLNTYYNGTQIVMKPGDRTTVRLSDTLPLNPGSYFVSFAVAGMKSGKHEDYDNLNNMMKINVVGPNEYWGLVKPNPDISVKAK